MSILGRDAMSVVDFKEKGGSENGGDRVKGFPPR